MQCIIFESSCPLPTRLQLHALPVLVVNKMSPHIAKCSQETNHLQFRTTETTKNCETDFQYGRKRSIEMFHEN